MRYKTQRQQEKNYVALKKAGDIKHQKRERERTPNIKKICNIRISLGYEFCANILYIICILYIS